MKTIKYPDGQLNIQYDLQDSTIIQQRINSYEDLFEVASKKEIIDYMLPTAYSALFIPCLFGQRSDRRFSSNESFGLKIITDFINNMKFSRVDIFDPHSDVSLALINNSNKQSSFEFVEKAVKDIIEKNTNKYGTILEPLVLVSPDAGAYKKVFKYAEDLNLPVVAANKFRDLAGNVTLNILGDVKGKNCLIVDDICDGGYTFYLLSKALREQGATKIALYISHAYFSKGFRTLLEQTDPNSAIENFLDHIYCTNSVKDIESELVTQYKII